MSSKHKVRIVVVSFGILMILILIFVSIFYLHFLNDFLLLLILLCCFLDSLSIGSVRSVVKCLLRVLGRCFLELCGWVAVYCRHCT